MSVIQRRGSVPCDSFAVISRNGCSGKSRNRKKILRRRSSGGADILSPILAEAETSIGGGNGNNNGSNTGNSLSASWIRFKRDITRNRSDLDSLLSKRRGSLPIEVFAVGHSGECNIDFNFFFLLFVNFQKKIYKPIKITNYFSKGSV